MLLEPGINDTYWSHGIKNIWAVEFWPEVAVAIVATPACAHFAVRLIACQSLYNTYGCCTCAITIIDHTGTCHCYSLLGPCAKKAADAFVDALMS